MASTVSQIIEDIRSFRPMDIKFIQRCINDFLDEKYHNGILIITEESVHRSTLWVHQFTEQVRSTISGV